MEMKVSGSRKILNPHPVSRSPIVPGMADSALLPVAMGAPRSFVKNDEGMNRDMDMHGHVLVDIQDMSTCR